MGFEITKESYAGSIKEISIGKGDKALTVGGQTCYPFYQFEGEMPNKAVIAMEIWDMAPEDWPEAALSPFSDVVSDTAAWAKKCVEEYGAEAIVLQLKSIDPNDKDASADSAVATVKSVLSAIDVPLIIWGCANPDKDEEVLKAISEGCQGENLILGPVEEKNHKGIGASAMGYGHTVISSSPIDVNLAKQVNILLENLGMPMDKVLVDPTTGGLGYGLEYSYSVMERLSMAAMTQGDDKLQLPMINNLGNEVWKCKEARLTADEAPELGDPERRGILMEAVGAVSYLMAGSSVLIMRHPEAVRLTRSFIGLLTDGGMATDVAPIAKKLDEAAIDYLALSPAPDLTIEEEKKAAPKKAAPKKAAAPAKAAAAAAPAAPAKPAVKEVKKEAAPAVSPEEAAKAAAATEAKAAVDAEAKAAATAEAKAAADAAAKAKAEADAKAKAEADAAAEKEKAAADKAKREADEEAIREERAKARGAQAANRATEGVAAVTLTPAAEQKSMLDKIIHRLDRIHKRVA